MSKLFDALNKTKGDIASFLLPVVDRAGSPGDEPRDVPIAVPLQHDLRITEPVTPAEKKQFCTEQINARNLKRLAFYNEPESIAADRFRLLRMRLREFWTAGKLKRLLITSPFPGDGKSTTALNLATALTEDGTRRVLLIDADLHRGSLTKELGIAPSAGLSECLQDGRDPISLIRFIEPLGWYLLSCGAFQPSSPTELLHPPELSGLFQRLAAEFDWIVVDCPPVLSLSDAVALKNHVDGILLVARAGCTPAKAIEDAISLVGKRHVIGMVLNGIEDSDQPYSAYHRYYDSRRPAPQATSD